MTTVAKILIAIVFVLSNVFLGFTLAAVNDRDDNPKYRYMREKWTRDVVQFDISRLQHEVEAQIGVRGELPISAAVDQFETMRRRSQDATVRAGQQRGEQLQEIRDLLTALNDKKVEITNFAATMLSYREAVGSVSRKYMSLQNDYHDAVRQLESLTIEREQLRVERERLLEDRRAIEEVMHTSREENRRLEQRISAMVRQNPRLPDLVRSNGRMVRGHVQSVTERGEVVVIDVGSNEGVARGQDFAIFDGSTGDFKATIEIRRVEPNRAVGVLKAPFRNVRITPNDEVQRAAIFRTDLAGWESSR